MARYEVIRPWFGVAAGDVIQTDRLHPAILPNVRLLADAGLEVATPKATSNKPKAKTKADDANE